MSFTMENIEEVLPVLKLIQDSKDLELHLDVGDMKLSVWKGEMGERAGSSLDSPRQSAICQARPAEAIAAPSAPILTSTPPMAAPAVVVPPKAQEAIEEGLHPIKANMISVFYRRPSPDEAPFVEVGSEVTEDSVLCLLEVMKCFRSVNAGVKGRVEKILVQDGQLVEYGTVLFLLRPI